MKEPLLKLENIAVGYNGRPLYSEVNDSVESGSLVAFLGENGAGKSTLLRSIAGRLKPLAGDVKIAGTDIAGLSRREMALTVSIVATGNTLAGALTVTELVSLGRGRRTKSSYFPPTMSPRHSVWHHVSGSSNPRPVPTPQHPVHIIHSSQARLPHLSPQVTSHASFPTARSISTPSPSTFFHNKSKTD